MTIFIIKKIVKNGIVQIAVNRGGQAFVNGIMKLAGLIIFTLALSQYAFAEEPVRMIDSFRQIMSHSGLDSAIEHYRTQRSQRDGEKKTDSASSFSPERAQLNELGYELLYQQKPGAAARVFQLNIDYFTHDWIDYESLAQAYYKQGYYAQALNYYLQALQIQEDGDSPLKGHKGLVKQTAKTYRKLGDYYAALNIYQIEVARDPEADWAVQKIGQWMLKYGNIKVGIRWLKRATDMQGSPDKAWKKLGHFLRKWSNYRYIHHLREGRDRFPYLAASWDQLVAALLDDYRPHEAERVIARALSLFPPYSLWRTAQSHEGRELIRAYTQDLSGEQFTAMGCGPYQAADEIALKHYMQVENASSTSKFIVHLGDLGKGIKDVPESRYANMADILSNKNHIPTFVLLGDNDWNDTANPAQSLVYWKHYLGNFYQRFDMPFYVSRQPQREENISFESDDVLYIGINLPAGRVQDEAEWSDRINDDARWIQHNLSTTHASAAIILAHAPADVFDGRLLTSLRKSAAQFTKPVLFLHANGHKWFYRQDEQQSNLQHVQLNKLHDKKPFYPPVQVRYTARKDIPFVFDRRIGEPAWQVKADRS